MNEQLNKHIYKYEITVFQESDGDEHVHKGVVLATSFAQAMDKLVKAFEYKGKHTSQYDCLICSVTIKEYVDEAGDYTDIYVFEEGEN